MFFFNLILDLFWLIADQFESFLDLKTKLFIFQSTVYFTTYKQNLL